MDAPNDVTCKFEVDMRAVGGAATTFDAQQGSSDWNP